MDYAGLLAKLRGLPKDKQEAVYDFVEFLTERYGNCSDGRSTGACSGTPIGEVAPSSGDDPVAYSLQDLKERWRWRRPATQRPSPTRFVHCNTQPFAECRPDHYQPSAYKIVRATKTPLRSS